MSQRQFTLGDSDLPLTLDTALPLHAEGTFGEDPVHHTSARDSRLLSAMGTHRLCCSSCG
eukprot:1621090-Amphidinium_carterae.2